MGGNFCSMPKGVVLSRTYNLIKGETMRTNSDMVKWSQHFSARVGNFVQLISEPESGYLSERDALDKGAQLIRSLI